MREFDFETYRVFTDLPNNCYGNTSSVVLLNGQIDSNRMQRIAADFWQPATTFLWKENDQWGVKWFAPDGEIDLCGHGSLAAVAFIYDHFESKNIITIEAGKQLITGGKHSDYKCFIELDAIPVTDTLPIPEYLLEALGVPIEGYFQTANKNIVLVDTEKSVQEMNPNYNLLRSSNTFGYAVTAKGAEVDFVSRTLVPHVQQLEDPATGSSHAALIPFWANRLDKTSFRSLQLSKRGGMFSGELSETKVRLFGSYQKINRGTICSF